MDLNPANRGVTSGRTTDSANSGAQHPSDTAASAPANLLFTSKQIADLHFSAFPNMPVDMRHSMEETKIRELTAERNATIVEYNAQQALANTAESKVDEALERVRKAEARHVEAWRRLQGLQGQRL